MAAVHCGRRKKLIWAIETAERLGRPSCSECNDHLRSKRGCYKPGYSVKGTMTWRFTSPMLFEMDAAILHECPVGAILREAPHVYDLVRAGAYAENSGIEVMSQSRYLQDALTLHAAERARMRELEQLDHQARSDARHGRTVLRGRR